MTKLCECKRVFAGCLMVAFLLCLWMPHVPANSAEPPRVVVFFSGTVPEDLALYAIFADGSEEPFMQKRVAWERFDLCYKNFGGSGAQPLAAIRAEMGGFSTVYDVSQEELSTYNNVFTLDISAGVCSGGKSPVRGALLVAMRVALTLLIEGAVFALFQYRKKRSWTVFLIVNLLTQGVLNIMLSATLYPTGYEIIGLVFGEFFIFAVEMIAMPLLIKEHGKLRAVLYALTANAVSLIAGGFMITQLPL